MDNPGQGNRCGTISYHLPRWPHVRTKRCGAAALKLRLRIADFASSMKMSDLWHHTVTYILKATLKAIPQTGIVLVPSGLAPLQQCLRCPAISGNGLACLSGRHCSLCSLLEHTGEKGL